jgi:predicted dehydrogenase
VDRERRHLRDARQTDFLLTVATKLIHVGVGVRGRHWLDIVTQHPDFVSAACVDSDQGALDKARRHPGQQHGKFFSSLKEAVSNVQADAALIASPTSLHVQHTLAALDAGLAVMVEKPMATSLTDAATVIEAARTASLPVMVAENYRFSPAERTVRRLLAAKRAGRISSAVCIDRRDQPSSTQGVWVKGTDHPFLMEIAVHHFDSFRYLFNGQPASMFATSYNPSGSSYDRNAAAEALIELDGGFPIQYAGTMIANRYEFRLSIEGEIGDIWTDRHRVWWRPRGRRFFRPLALVPVPKGDELPYPKSGTVSLLNQFRDAIVHGQVPETSADDNLWTIAMVEASILSNQDGRRVRIDEVVTPALRRRLGLTAS